MGADLNVSTISLDILVAVSHDVTANGYVTNKTTESGDVQRRRVTESAVRHIGADYVSTLFEQ